MLRLLLGIAAKIAATTWVWCVANWGFNKTSGNIIIIHAASEEHEECADLSPPSVSLMFWSGAEEGTISFQTPRGSGVFRLYRDDDECDGDDVCFAVADAEYNSWVSASPSAYAAAGNLAAAAHWAYKSCVQLSLARRSAEMHACPAPHGGPWVYQTRNGTCASPGPALGDAVVTANQVGGQGSTWGSPKFDTHLVCGFQRLLPNNQSGANITGNCRATPGPGLA